jgi:hypothetical protein
VCFDFLLAEWPLDSGANMEGSDDYLHEMAQIPSPPSGTNYDPAGTGGLTESAGVHEHWNNATDKLYSRDIDPINGTGIELATYAPTLPEVGDFDGDGDVDVVDYTTLADAWGTKVGDADWDDGLDISVPQDGVIDDGDLWIFCGAWLVGI